MSGRLSAALTLHDLHQLARSHLPGFVSDFIDGGADSESCVRRNREALDAVLIEPRYLVDCSASITQTSLLGRTWSMPVGIAPTGLIGVARPRGDIARAKAARRAGVPFILAAASTDAIEEVAAAAPGHVWFQIYPMKDRAVGDDLLDRASRAGIETLIVTVDVPVQARKLRDVRNGFGVPIRFSMRTIADIALHRRWGLSVMGSGTPGLANFDRYSSDSSSAASLASFIAAQTGSAFDWAGLTDLRRAWRGHLVVKGLMRPDDVSRAVAAGADGVIVSNHGGRQFDAAPSPIDTLVACIDAVHGRIPVMIDSGIRSGLDVARCAALGAAFTFVGRPSIHAVAAGGEAGVDRMFEILRDELERTLRQCGAPRIADLSSLGVRRGTDGAQRLNHIRNSPDCPPGDAFSTGQIHAR